MSGSTGDLERGASSSLPLLDQPAAGSSRLAPSAAADDDFTETTLNLPHLPPKAKGSSGWRWGGGGAQEEAREGGPWKSNIIPFSLPKRKRLKGPLRAARLCLLSILLPALLLTLPLYVRYRIYGRGEAFPLAASDMRLIDSHISTTWCQRQLVEANASFNAFLMPETPQVEEEPQKVTMQRSLYLDDDMKEYWGFYLLKGSSVSISACARWPGAALIVIKGHRHLRECAYIGEKSSEESDEMMLVDAESEMNLTEAGNDDKSVRSKGRSRQVILNEKLTWKSPRVEKKRAYLPPSASISLERNVEPPTTAGPIETSSEIYEDILKRIMQMGDRGQRVLQKLKNKLQVENKEENLRNDGGKDSKSQTGKKDTSESAEASLLRKIIEQVVKEAWERNQVVQKRNDGTVLKSNSEVSEHMIGSQKEGLSNTESVTEKTPATLASEQLNVKNVTKDLVEIDGLKREVPGVNDGNIVDKEIDGLLQRARRAILQESLDLAGDEENKVLNEEQESLEEGHIPKPDGIADDRGTFDDWDPNDRSRSEFWSSFSSSEEALLVCDGLVLYMPLTPHLSCNENEGFGKSYNKISDQTTKTDGRHGLTETTTARGEDRENTLSYQVPANGYYFFVFNSENEVQTNFLHIHFDLRRRVYKVKDPIAMCHNATHCELPLSFLSDQKVVLELPLKQGDTNYSDPLLVNGQLAERKNQTLHTDTNSKQASHQGSLSRETTPDPTGNEKSSKKHHGVEGGEALLWDESYVVVTTCEPRTTLYLCFIISVPLLILLFAFQ